MNTKDMGIVDLQTNITMLKNLTGVERIVAIKAFHKAGHIIMYTHQSMRFENAHLDKEDTIEGDLSFESLKDTNDPERFALILMGGIMMERMISQSDEVSEHCETDIEKVILLIKSAISNTPKSPEYYLIIANAACQILIKNQKYITKIYHELIKNRTFTYSQIQLILNNR